MYLFKKIINALTPENINLVPLESMDIEGVAKLIKEDKVQNIITIAGAGISTSCGIPDFRSPISGIYENLDEFNLPNPMAVFSIDYFNVDPRPFFEVSRRLYKPDARPSLGHYFVALLNSKKLLRRHISQNVDRLERLAGLPEEKLIEAHGSFHTGHCIKCSKLHDFDYMKDEIMAKKVPSCTASSCEGIVKPDLVFYGEQLPSAFESAFYQDLPNCDLLIVMGTSLTVQPCNTTVHHVGKYVPRVFINRDALNIEDNWVAKRDVHVVADIDETVERLAGLLGWREELLQLKKTNDADLDAKAKAK